jgi:hypothetical protein
MPEHDTLADPVAEVHRAVDALLRVGTASGVQFADGVLRQRLSRERAETHDREEQQRQAEARQRAQRETARLLWRRAFDTGWWDQATAEQIARTYEAAYVYADTDPDAANALVRLDQQLERRHLHDRQREQPAESDQPSEQDQPTASPERVRDLVADMRANIDSDPNANPSGHPAGSPLLNEDEVATVMKTSLDDSTEITTER